MSAIDLTGHAGRGAYCVLDSDFYTTLRPFDSVRFRSLCLQQVAFRSQYRIRKIAQVELVAVHNELL